MTIKLSPEMEQIVDEKIRSGDFATAEDVVLAALMGLKYQPREIEFENGRDKPAIEHYGAPDDLRVSSKEHLNQLLQEAEESPAAPMTKEDWVQFRRELVERYGPRKGE